MNFPEYKRWSYGGGALALAGLVGAAVATRYSTSPTELHPGVYAGLIIFLAGMPIIGAGGLLEAAANGKAQIKLGYIAGFLCTAVGALILVLSLTMNAPRIAQHLGLAFAAMILVTGTVNLLCSRMAQEIRKLRGNVAAKPVGQAAAL